MEEKLGASVPGMDFQFGWTLALSDSGDLAAIGSPWDDTLAFRAGSVDVFRRTPGTGQWVVDQQLTANDWRSAGHFGQDVDMLEDEIFVGSVRQDGMGIASGSAYTFRYEGGQWREVRKLVSPEPLDTFGIRVSLTDSVSVVGAWTRGALNTGGVHLFRPNDVPFVRGDCAPDGMLTIEDAMVLLDYLFSQGAVPPCRDACDLDDDSLLGIGDPIRLINHLFGIGPIPPAPSASCDCEAEVDNLECAAFAACP